MWLVIVLITVSCSAYIVGDLLGTSLRASIITVIPNDVLGPMVGIIILILGLTGSYKTIEKVMIFLISCTILANDPSPILFAIDRRKRKILCLHA
jgi:manganese transport protein